MAEWENWRPGVLNKRQLMHLCDEGLITNVDTEKIQDPSSIDLHITEEGHRLKGCAKPQSSFDIPALIDTYKDSRLEFEDGNTVLERKKTYIFRVKESLNLTKTQFTGQATGKSTFGRLDILTRLLTSHGDSYDEVGEAYTGSLWVEVTPITFPIKINSGTSLNQLRLYKGHPSACRIEEKDLRLWGDLIFDEAGNSIAQKVDESLRNLTLNLDEDPRLGERICAFAAKKQDDLDRLPELDLTGDLSKGGYIPSYMYWQKLPPSQPTPPSLEIEPERFYILRSRERFDLPKSVAIYCQAVTETLGELRIHYAGFVHPCFGYGREDKKGAPLIFEVRGHNIQAFLQHGETLARLEYYFMSEDADQYKCHYSDQELTLSKFFSEE